VKHIISLGAGVQSTTMALLAEHGQITPKPDFCVFADTGHEPAHVYTHLKWLETQLSFPIHHTKYGNLSDDMDMVPFYIIKDGVKGMGQRRCTKYYKTMPVEKKIRDLLALQPRERTKGPIATVWVGISIDEVQRMKDSTNKWSLKRHPLIDLGMNRQDCLKWMKEQGYPEPAKSACVFCPYTDNMRWKDMKQNQPEDFKEAIKWDNEVRHMSKEFTSYLHRNAIPLEDAVFTDDDIGQTNMFNDECDGVCGV
jgi:hypothetical protein